MRILSKRPASWRQAVISEVVIGNPGVLRVPDNDLGNDDGLRFA